MGYLHCSTFRICICLILIDVESLQAHPQAAKWRNKTFPLFKEIDSLLDGNLATGDHVFQAGHVIDVGFEDQDPSHDDHDSSDSEILRPLVSSRVCSTCTLTNWITSRSVELRLLRNQGVQCH
jgi:hypothetical protein